MQGGASCFSGEGGEMCSRSFHRGGHLWINVSFSPVPPVSGVKTCEDATRSGFPCPSVWDVIGMVTLWPLALVYLL